MAKKMPRGLVALSASAIAAIYVAGYAATQGADASLGESAADPIAALIAPGPSAAKPAPTAFALKPPFATPVAPGQPSAQTTYRDGTYQGAGTSRRGGVKVAVTIQDGRITTVKFTQVTTEYPVPRIAALPGQVVSRQSAQVDRVSGATFSSQAFQQAVAQALSQA